MANTMDKLRELSASLKADAAALRRDGVYGCCAGTYGHAAAQIDAILRESEAQGDVGAVEAWERRLRGRAGPFTAQAGERYVDADVALEAFRFALAASATPSTEPAEGREAVAWQYRFRLDGGEWFGWHGIDKAGFEELTGEWGGLSGRVDGREYEARALYTTPPAGDGARLPAGWHIKRIEDGMIIVSGPIGGVTVQEDRGRIAERVLWALADAILTDRTHGDGARVTEAREIVELATRLRDRYVANRHDSRYTFIACITPGVSGRDACRNDGGVAADWIALDDALNALAAREGGAS